MQDTSHPGRTRPLQPTEQVSHTSTLRAISNGLAQGFKANRSSPLQRYAEYGEQLATLQRHALTAGIPRTVLAQIPAGERVALQRAVDSALQRQQEEEAHDAEALHLHALQRQLAELEEEATRPVLQRIQARRGAGNPLPAAVQRHLEQGLNHDLSGVRIHDDAEAHGLAKGVNAVAFTTGSDIFFQSGRFNPNTQSGLELLAHETTHVVQQSKGQVGRGIDPDAGLEQEARSTGARLARSPAAVKATSPRLAPPKPGRAAPPASGAVQRAAAPTAAAPGAAHATVATPAAQGVAQDGPAAIAAFKRRLQKDALQVLRANDLRLREQGIQYEKTAPSTPAWQDLRVLAAKQAQLEARWGQLTAQLQKLAGYDGDQTFDQVQTLIGAAQGGHGRLSDSADRVLRHLMKPQYFMSYTPGGMSGQQGAKNEVAFREANAAQLKQIFTQIAQLDDARDLMHDRFPALGVLGGQLGAQQLAKLPNTAANNAQLNARLKPEFVKVLKAIAKMEHQVAGGDLPWKNMDVLVQQVLGEMGVSEKTRKTDKQSGAVLGWLEGQKRTDFWIGIGALVATLGLTVASFFVPGSTLLIVADLAVGGTVAAAGVVGANRQLAVSNTQALGGQALSSVSRDAAERDNVIAMANLALAGLPIAAAGAGAAVRAGRAVRGAAGAGEVLGAERTGQAAVQEAAQAGRPLPEVEGASPAGAGTRNASPRTAGSVDVGASPQTKRPLPEPAGPALASDIEKALTNRKLSDEQIEALVKKTKNWEELKSYIGMKADKGARPPPGYEWFTVEGETLVRRMKGNKASGEYAPLTVENGIVVLKAGGSNRISVASRYRSNYLQMIEETQGKAARAAVEARIGGETGNQLHHLIADGVAQRSPLVREALARVKGYTIDRGTNILDMPTVHDTGTNQLLHRGSHPLYDTYVNNLLDDAQDVLTNNRTIPLEKVSPAALDKALQATEDKLRNAIHDKTLNPKLLKELEEGGQKLSAIPQLNKPGEYA